MIRNYTKEDKDSVKALYKNNAVNKFEQHTVSVFLSVFKDCCYVYYDGNALIGFIGAVGAFEEDTVYVYSLNVEKSYKRLDVGMRLIEAVVLKAHNLGCNKLAFSIKMGNDEEMALFRKIGKKFNTKPHFIGNFVNSEFVDVIYKLDLGKR